MHLRELVIILKVVVNKIVDIIVFDQNTVRSNLKKTVRSKFVSLVNFGSSRRKFIMKI